MNAQNNRANRDTDNIYFNAIIAGPQNNNEFKGDAAFIAEFASTRTTTLVPCASDYYCSIVRFTIPLDQIPLLIMPILPGCDTYGVPPANPRNITPFIIGIRYNGVTYTQNIGANNFAPFQPNLSQNMIFVTPDPSVEKVFQTSLATDKISVQYQGIYSYEVFLNMINVSLALAYAAFQAANPGAPQAVANVAPFFIFDPATQLISLITHISWASLPNQFVLDPPGVARVCFNFELSVYLQGFNTITANDNVPTIPNNDSQIVVQNYGNNGYPTNVYPAIPTFLATSQDYNIISNWNSLRKLLITTNTLPIRSEAVPTDNLPFIDPLTGVVTDLITGDITGSNSSSKPIISDFVPQLTTAGDSRSIAYYNPIAQYRLVDMNQDIPIQKIDLKIYWEDKDNNIYPLRIGKYNQASIKLGFFKKSLYKDQYHGGH